MNAEGSSQYSESAPLLHLIRLHGVKSLMQRWKSTIVVFIKEFISSVGTEDNSFIARFAGFQVYT